VEKNVSTREEGCPWGAATLLEDPSSKSSIPLLRILAWLDPPLPFPLSLGLESAELVSESLLTSLLQAYIHDDALTPSCTPRILDFVTPIQVHHNFKETLKHIKFLSEQSSSGRVSLRLSSL